MLRLDDNDLKQNNEIDILESLRTKKAQKSLWLRFLCSHRDSNYLGTDFIDLLRLRNTVDELALILCEANETINIIDAIIKETEQPQKHFCTIPEASRIPEHATSQILKGFSICNIIESSFKKSLTSNTPTLEHAEMIRNLLGDNKVILMPRPSTRAFPAAEEMVKAHHQFMQDYLTNHNLHSEVGAFLQR